MHKTLGQRDPGLAFPLAQARDDADERRQANPELAIWDADALGRLVAGEISRQLPEAGSLTWTTRAVPA
jgi:hypothetical protein